MKLSLLLITIMILLLGIRAVAEDEEPASKPRTPAVEPERDVDEPAEPTDTAEQTDPAAEGEADPPTEETDEQVLQELLRRRGENQPIEPKRPRDQDTDSPERDAAQSPAPAPEVDSLRGTAPRALRAEKQRAEGAFVIARRGRMVPAKGNATPWAFAFDSDSSGLDDPPVYLMPCEELQAMEAQAQEQGPDATFIVSGELFTYRGNHYLLPRLAKIAPRRGNLEP